MRSGLPGAGRRGPRGGRACTGAGGGAHGVGAGTRSCEESARRRGPHGGGDQLWGGVRPAGGHPAAGSPSSQSKGRHCCSGRPHPQVLSPAKAGAASFISLSLSLSLIHLGPTPGASTPTLLLSPLSHPPGQGGGGGQPEEPEGQAF